MKRKWLKYSIIGGIAWTVLSLFCTMFSQATNTFYYSYLFKPFEPLANISDRFLRDNEIIKGDDIFMGMIYFILFIFTSGAALGLAVYLIKLSIYKTTKKPQVGSAIADEKGSE